MLGSGPRCNAITARGTACQRPAVNGGPCAWHTPARRPEPRAWPLARRWRLMDLIERGWPDDRIGRELGVSADAVKLARRRYRIPPKSKTCLTARQIAKRLGLGCAKTVTRWIEQDWLKGRHGWTVGKHRAWIVQEEALLDFIANPEHFHRWHPERIPDKALREWAIAQRHGERFLTLTEAADWLCRQRFICVERETVAQWIERGRLPAVRNGRGNRQVRERDLATFERPVFGQGSRKRTWDPCAMCGDPDGLMLPGCVTPSRHDASRHGINGKVCTRCKRKLRYRESLVSRMAA